MMYEAVISDVIRVKSNDLSGIVDAKGKIIDTRWRIDARVLPVAVNKSVGPNFVGASWGMGGLGRGRALVGRTGPDCIIDTTSAALIFG